MEDNQRKSLIAFLLESPLRGSELELVLSEPYEPPARLFAADPD